MEILTYEASKSKTWVFPPFEMLSSSSIRREFSSGLAYSYRTCDSSQCFWQIQARLILLLSCNTSFHTILYFDSVYTANVRSHKNFKLVVNPETFFLYAIEVFTENTYKLGKCRCHPVLKTFGWKQACMYTLYYENNSITKFFWHCSEFKDTILQWMFTSKTSS